jgi:hypothetical protein
VTGLSRSLPECREHLMPAFHLRVVGIPNFQPAVLATCCPQTTHRKRKTTRLLALRPHYRSSSDHRWTIRQRWFGPLHDDAGDSIPEIYKPGLNQPLNDSKKNCGRNPKQQHSIRRFKWSQQSPRRRHNHVTVTQRRVIDCGVVKGSSKVCKFSADYEQQPPQGDLHKVRQQRIQHNQDKDSHITPGVHANTAESSFAANKVDSGSEWQHVNQDRADYGHYANRQGDEDRHVMNLWQHTSILARAIFNPNREQRATGDVEESSIAPTSAAPRIATAAGHPQWFGRLFPINLFA